MEIAVLNVVNKNKNIAMNKDLNGGFGTADRYANTLPGKILMFMKKRYINLPVISLVNLMGIFKERGIYARFYEGEIPRNEPDIALIYGSIVDYKNENLVCRLLKNRFQKVRVGFIGPFPSVKPDLFKSGDFIIVGDFEYFFLKEFKDKAQLDGKVVTEKKTDMDELPNPSLEGFPIARYNYSPLITKRPFFTLQTSKGCPYQCSYYCVYGKFQGNNIITRSPKKVVADMVHLRDRYGIKAVQFRDPLFGIKRGYIEELCDEITRTNLKIQWGIETRPELLDKEKVRIMFKAGLRNINLGIETDNKEIANGSKRTLADKRLQEELIRYCEKMGIKISAFYIFGYEHDTKTSMELTLEYAKRLNTFLARFAVYTPYPGTPFFDDTHRQGKILTYDYENYTQFNVVMKHNNLNERDIQNMLSKAYKEYYFRPRYILKLLKWKMREFTL